MIGTLSKITPRHTPPQKQAGQGRGPRRIDGACMDVRGGSVFFGWTEKKTRGMVERKLIPFRRLNGRIIFLKRELEQWLVELDGCSVAEAVKNLARRRGDGT